MYWLHGLALASWISIAALLFTLLLRYRSAIQGMGKIARHEGISSLWRGSDMAVLMSGPFIAIYLPLYDRLHKELTTLGEIAP